MHPLPTHLTPTSPGVYWCGDVQWIKYLPALETRILEGYKTQTRLVNIGPVTSIGPKKSSPGDYKVDLTLNVQVSPVGMRRGVLVVPPISLTSATPAELTSPKTTGLVYWLADEYWIEYPPAISQRILQAHRTQRTGLVNIGPVTSIGASPGDYKVDLDLNEQVCPVGMRRKVLIVPPVVRRGRRGHRPGKNDKTSAEDRALLALMNRIKGLYLRHVNHFLEEGKKHHVSYGKEPPTLVVRDNLWDLQCAQLRKFLELAKKHGASESDPRVFFGYHGTSAENADKSFLECFSTECRYCSSGAGAYFSGELEYSAQYARDHHEVELKNSARPTSKPEGPGDILLVALLLDGDRSAPIFGDHDLRAACDDEPVINVPVINVERCVFDEKYAMPLARLRGF